MCLICNGNLRYQTQDSLLTDALNSYNGSLYVNDDDSKQKSTNKTNQAQGVLTEHIKYPRKLLTVV